MALTSGFLGPVHRDGVFMDGDGSAGRAALADRLETYRSQCDAWDRRNPDATTVEREQAYSLMFLNLVLGREQILGLCRVCGRIHPMTMVPLASDPTAFRIECKCARSRGRGI